MIIKARAAYLNSDLNNLKGASASQKIKFKKPTQKTTINKTDMHAAFYIGAAQALLAYTTLAIELKASSDIATADSHFYGVTSLA